MHTFSASFPITNHPSNSNCSFLTGPCVDTQSFGNVTSRPEPAWEHTDEFFPAALAPVLLSYNYISACVPNKPKKCRSIKDSTSRTSNTFRAVRFHITLYCRAERSWNPLVCKGALWLWAHLEPPHLSKTGVMTHIWMNEALNWTSNSYTEPGKCVLDRRGLF